MKHKIIALILSVFLFGCSSFKYNEYKSRIYERDIICLNSNLLYASTLWYEEASKKFTNPVIVCCHGGYNEKHFWTAYPDIDVCEPVPVILLANRIKDKYPNREILLVICNDLGEEINVPHVWYFKKDVWTVPNDVSKKTEQGSIHIYIIRHTQDAAGSIFEAYKTR